MNGNGEEQVSERGNEGKQAEMSIHTHHTHIHTRCNLLAEMSTLNPISPFLLTLPACWVDESSPYRKSRLLSID